MYISCNYIKHSSLKEQNGFVVRLLLLTRQHGHIHM